MLGITTPDAVAVGTLIIAVLAAYRGMASGGTAKQNAINAAPFVSIAGSIVDSNQFSDYIKTLDKLSIAMVRHADALDRQHEVKTTNALEALAEKVDRALDRRR